MYITVKEFSEDRQLPIDKQIALSDDAAGDSIYVANTERRRWLEGQPVILENSDGYQEEGEIAEVVYGSGANDTQIVLLETLADDSQFTTAKSANVRINQFFTGLTVPSSGTVERWILEAQKQIESHCRKGWSEQVWEGYLAWDPSVYPHIVALYGEMCTFKIPVVDIVTPLDEDFEDSLKLFTGSAEEEKLGSWTYGRTNDYWIDAQQGFLFLRTQRPLRSRNAVWLRCRYGATEVPEDVKAACSLIVVRKFMRSDQRAISGAGKPHEGEAWPYPTGTPSWAEIKGLLAPYVRDVIGWA